MSFRPFVRALGSQPGVQLNPIIDSTDGTSPDNSDQVFGVLARLTRGRIDRPFRVNRANFLAKTGPAASIKSNALNEAKIQTLEALRNGAYEAVVQRLIAGNSAQSYAVLNFGSGAVLTPTVTAGAVTGATVTAGGTGYQTGQDVEFSGLGTGAKATIIATAGVITGVTILSGGAGYTTAPTARMAESISYTVSPTVPTTFSAYLQHLGCFNDGIQLSIHADSTPVGGTAVANKEISLRVYDVYSGDILVEVEGSLDSAATDDFGNSAFLPDVLSNATDGEYLLTVATGASIATDSGAYGRTPAGAERWNTSDALVLFSEGSLTYTDAELDACVGLLRDTNTPYGYLISGGTQSIPLISKLVAMAVETNTIMALDISGKLNPTAAIAFMNSLAIDTHYVGVYYAPIEAFDSMNGYRETWGVGGLNIGLRCGRNARANAKGFAPKNYPVAGKDWPISRQQMRQTYTLTEGMLSDMARAKFNPCMFELYNGGGRYVFSDSLTAAATVVSFKKLISVAEMSSSIDTAVATYAKELTQLPMSEAISRMDSFLSKYLEYAQAAAWLVPSINLPGGAAFQYTVEKSTLRPDLLRVEYSCSYDGVARQIILQQRLVK